MTASEKEEGAGESGEALMMGRKKEEEKLRCGRAGRRGKALREGRVNDRSGEEGKERM